MGTVWMEQESDEIYIDLVQYSVRMRPIIVEIEVRSGFNPESGISELTR
jgi:hypothetical protein